MMMMMTFRMLISVNSSVIRQLLLKDGVKRQVAGNLYLLHVYSWMELRELLEADSCINYVWISVVECIRTKWS